MLVRNLSQLEAALAAGCDTLLVLDEIGQGDPREISALTYMITGSLGKTRMGRDATLKIDPQLFQEIFVELFANAFQHDRGKGALVARARISDGQFLFTLHEPKPIFSSNTENWGREPLRNIRQRHYGLGLSRVRAIIEAHAGQFGAQYDSKAAALVSTVALPVSKRHSEHG